MEDIELQHAARRAASDKLKSLNVRFPGRKAQIIRLNNLIGRGQCVGPEVVYIWGDTASGKTTVIQSYFQLLHYDNNNCVYINCTEGFTPKIFYERILNTFNCSFPTFPPVDFKKNFIKCSQLSVFIELLSDIVLKRKEVFTWYLVVDQVEKLKDTNWNFLPIFFKLSEKTGVNFSTVLVGKVPWENLAPSIGVQDPIILHFPEYSKLEIIEILTRTSPHTLPPLEDKIKNNIEVFRTFAGLLYETVYRACRNVKEMQHIATQIYPQYVQPILDGTILPNETTKLFTQCRPQFEQVTNNLYSRGGNFSAENITKQSSSLLHLPYYSKFLLVASYLASYNPAKTDINYFYKGCINQVQKRQRNITNPSKQTDKMAKIPTSLLGPKPFTIERMLAIFYSIVDNPELATTVHIDTQIATLISLQLLAPTGSKSSQSAKLSQLKYKAVLSLDATQSIAKQLDFQLDRFLFSE